MAGTGGSAGGGRKVVLSRAGKGDRLPGLWFPGHGAAVVIADAEGAIAARARKLAADLLRAHRPVLLLDVFQTGSAIAPRDRSHPYFLTFNRSDDANRVQDILTALAWLRASGHREVELAGEGPVAIWCLFAAAAAPGPVKLDADTNFGSTDQEYESLFPVPAIRKAGGAAAARRVYFQLRTLRALPR